MLLASLLVPLASAAPTIDDHPYGSVVTEPPKTVWASGTDGIGVGVVLGLPTGLSAAYRPGGPLWGQADVAWSFENDTFALNVDALFTLATPAAEHNADFRFPIYVGAGARFRFGESAGSGGYNDSVVGVRIPVGMCFTHEGFPIEAFVEMAPGVGIVPDTRGVFDIGVGARFYIPGSVRSSPAAP